MKQEEILKSLIQELFSLDEVHNEYLDNDTHYVLDSKKEGNTLTITVTLDENTDKQDFEKWLSNVPDDLFSEVLTNLEGEGLYNLESIYSSPDYKQVIDKVKSKTIETLQEQIEECQNLLKQLN